MHNGKHERITQLCQIQEPGLCGELSLEDYDNSVY